MKATVLVRPKEGIVDPQGEAVQSSLAKLGLPVSRARIGRLVDLELDASDLDSVRTELDRVSQALLANPLIESYEIRLEGEAT